MLFLQVHGYFIKYGGESGRPPLVFVLSEKSAKLILLPFVNKERTPIVENVLLEDYPLWVGTDDGVSLNRKFLVLLLLLCAGRNSLSMEVEYQDDGTSKKKSQPHIKSVFEAQVDKIEMELAKKPPQSHESSTASHMSS